MLFLLDPYGDYLKAERLCRALFAVHIIFSWFTIWGWYAVASGEKGAYGVAMHACKE